MPRFIFKNIPKEDVQHFSKTLLTQSATIIDCPTDWLTFERACNHVYLDGENITSNQLFLEISWFNRGQAVQDQLATYLFNNLNSFYNETKEITLIFTDLDKGNYYEQGKNYL